MPKTYSEKEREAIITALRFHAAQCLSSYGVKKTTVDEIVRRAKIPKGTFYLFYESKEILLFEVIQQWHDTLQTEFVQNIGQCTKPITVDILTSAIFEIYKKIESTGLINILSNGEMEALIRKLPEKIVAEHLLQDEDMVGKLIQHIPSAAGKDIKAFSAAFRGLFFTLLFQREIGENFDNALEITIRGLLQQLLEDDIHDSSK